ncbi:MAG: hypothetical protein A2Y73_03765 [Chloroflexi bacterium RBG_13_56_8]|nr:MAG: hypothetical protein A2Y73_03765 [Chloroflexi bacterium RBG_13_56_8]
MSQKLGKHTPYYELVEAQGLAGCPICRLARKATDRYLDSILYEAVLDPAVRTKLKASRGFCAEHIEMLRRKPGRALGVALIYRDILRVLAEVLEKGRYRSGHRFWGRRGGGGGAAMAEELKADEPCPACAIGRETERDHVELLLAHLGDDELYKAYSGGEGLCLVHFVQALEAVDGEETFQRLVQPQLARYRVMLADLDEFIRKRDYRFRKEEYGQEGDVWLRVMNAVVGGAGMGLSAKAGGRRSPDIFES